jgi:hypothetical protein
MVSIVVSIRTGVLPYLFPYPAGQIARNVLIFQQLAGCEGIR